MKWKPHPAQQNESQTKNILTMGLSFFCYLALSSCLFWEHSIGRSFQATALIPRATPSTATQDSLNSSLMQYINDDFRISFEYPKGGKIAEWKDEVEGLNEIEFYFDHLSRIFIKYEDSEISSTPKAWFDANRDSYNYMITEIGETEVNGNPALFLGIPNTCYSAPIIVAVVQAGKRVYIFTHFETGDRTYADELGQILNTVEFNGRERKSEFPAIPDKYIRFPEPPPGLDCPSSP